MKIVLLSGGAGKRLWPMSTDSRSKQFLKVLRDDRGNPTSMLQRVWQQLAAVGLQQDAYICSSRGQVEMIESQLGPVPILEEPSRRDTFPAISLATMFLRDVEGCSDDEVVAVMPVDPFVNLEFFKTVRRLEKVLSLSGAKLALMGVEPTEPTNKFGYIRTTSKSNGGELQWSCVDSFVEKPDEDVAAQLIQDGALWNCGVFCFRIGFLKSKLESLGYPTDYFQIVDQFDSLPKRSFDYEVVEKVRGIVVAPYKGIWSDLGSWGSLSEQIQEDFVGKGTSVDCENTHIINELGIPIVAMGLNDMMVVSTPDGILVADKEHAAGIKQAAASWSGRPMYEERRWGTYRVLDYQKLGDNSEVLTKSVELLPGRFIRYQRHLKRSEVWTVIQGHGELVIDSKVVEVSTGDVFKIHPGQWHGIRAINGLQFIEVQRGSELIEEDIERKFETWEEVLEHCTSPLLV